MSKRTTNSTPSKANGHSNGSHPAPESTPAKTPRATQKTGEREHVSWPWTLAVAACLLGTPVFMYYCWICVEFNTGALLMPASAAPDEIARFFRVDIFGRIVKYAIPSWYTWSVYLIWTAWQALMFIYAPGPVGEGAQLENGSRLKYKFNGQFAWFSTIAVMAALHVTKVFPITRIYDLFPEFLSVCLIWTSLVCLALDVWGRVTGQCERMTDSYIYDYFMGPIQNPRLGQMFDIKFFFELRPGIMHWYATTIAIAVKQYEVYGVVSTPMLLVCFFHLCFVNACYKGEQCVPQSIDIIREKLGWMLLMLDLVMVPFVFPLQAYYLFKLGPMEHSALYTTAIALMHVLGYWMFDTANSQKDYFREKEVHGHEMKKGFPRLPWDKLENPKFLQTKRGTKLLLSGWWGYARHMNYLGDMLMSWAWALICGSGSYFPWAYTTYLTPLLLHRLFRDDRDCRRKYGADWDDYCKRVPYRLIPGVF